MSVNRNISLMVGQDAPERNTPPADAKSGTLGDALWLARREMRGSLLYHLGLAIVMLMTGAFVAFFFSVALEEPLSGDPSDSSLMYEVTAVWHSIVSDWFLLVMLLFLTIAWSTKNPWRSGKGIVGRLSFLRSLPISTRCMVMSQAVRMLASLVLASPLLFAPAYLFVASLRAELGLVQYLWFAALWMSYSLVVGCVISFLELGTRVKVFEWFFFYATWVLLLVAVVVNIVFGTTLIEGAIHLVRAYGPLPATTALLAGFSALILVWRSVAERRLKRRGLES